VSIKSFPILRNTTDRQAPQQHRAEPAHPSQLPPAGYANAFCYSSQETSPSVSQA